MIKRKLDSRALAYEYALAPDTGPDLPPILAALEEVLSGEGTGIPSLGSRAASVRVEEALLMTWEYASQLMGEPVFRDLVESGLVELCSLPPMAPLTLAAARLERRRSGSVIAIEPTDIESILLLTLPFIELPPDLSGECRLGVESSFLGERKLWGVTVSVNEGRISTTRRNPSKALNSWVTGSPENWLAALVAGETQYLDVDGTGYLGPALLKGLCTRLSLSA